MTWQEIQEITKRRKVAMVMDYWPAAGTQALISEDVPNLITTLEDLETECERLREANEHLSKRVSLSDDLPKLLTDLERMQSECDRLREANSYLSKQVSSNAFHSLCHW